MSIGKLRAAAILDTLLGSTVYLSLHTGAPGEDGQAGNEATGTGYVRKSIAAGDWDAATALVTMATAGGDWSAGADFTHFGLWDHASNTAEANFIGWGALALAKPVLNGDTPKFAAGLLALSLD
jgi:hypothetical protein